MSYIKREPLLQIAKELQGSAFGSPLIVKAIEEAPTEDVVEVVRCQDCFYAEETEGIIGGICLYCTHWCKDVDGDTFCSNGFSTISKRRE